MDQRKRTRGSEPRSSTTTTVESGLPDVCTFAVARIPESVYTVHVAIQKNYYILPSECIKNMRYILYLLYIILKKNF